MDDHTGHDHPELDPEARRMWEDFEGAQERSRNASGPDDLSWGDSLLNIASCIILLHPANLLRRGLNDDAVLKATSTLFHVDTVSELVRLARILNATEGFENKRTVHAGEAQDNAPLPVEDDVDDIRARFNRLMGLDK